MTEKQECGFCKNPESILSKETCCTGCSKLKLDGFIPPPWNIEDYPEKTEGWIAFQREYSHIEQEAICFCEFCEGDKLKSEIAGFICTDCMNDFG